MHKLYELKDELITELEKYAGKQTLDIQTLQVIDTLAHSAKNICKIIDSNEEKQMYSGMQAPVMPQYSMYPGGQYSMRNTHRDSMGRYSRANSDFRMELQGMIDNAPNESVRQKLMGIMNEV